MPMFLNPKTCANLANLIKLEHKISHAMLQQGKSNKLTCPELFCRRPNTGRPRT